jgi:hypothetical protein
MSDNINGTTDLREPDPLEWDEYQDGGGGTKIVLPTKGAYALLPTNPPDFSKPTKEGYLQAELTPGMPFDGYEVRFTRVNTKKWPKRNGNGLADYLRSHGYQGACRTNAEYQQVAEGLTNHPAHGVLDWEVYCKVCKHTLKGQEHFPKDAEGKSVQYINCPVCSTKETPVRLWANVRVVAFTPPPAG